MKKSENRQEPEKAPPAAIPPIIVKPVESHVCILPAKPKPAFAPPSAKPPAAPPKPKPEPSLEQKVADEVERRLINQVGALALGFFVGEMVERSSHNHHRD